MLRLSSFTSPDEKIPFGKIVQDVRMIAAAMSKTAVENDFMMSPLLAPKNIGKINGTTLPTEGY